MKFSLINGQRQEAQPNLSGKCPACGQAMVARCGKINIWHWAHKGRRACDLWWENETEWHRTWKGRFPESWQEVVHRADNGERHIADVKTDHGWVIEFQHSHIKPEEHRSRETFYRKLVWVIDGKRRKTDSAQFLNALNTGTPIGSNSLVRIPFSDTCTILREWVGSHAPVFIDFGDEHEFWWILKGTADGSAYVTRFPRSQFIEIHRLGATQELRDIFEKFVNDLSKLVSQFESYLMIRASVQAGRLPAPGFQQYPILRRSLRRRL